MPLTIKANNNDDQAKKFQTFFSKNKRTQ